MPTITRPGATVHYEITGEGPTIILGHSLLCDGRMWGVVLPALQKRWRLINVDARGHRNSTATAPFSLDDLAADWLAIMDKEKVEKAALCGLSMGGMTGMRLALSQPERVGPMVLLDTSADPEPRWHRVKYAAMAAIARRFGMIERFMPTVKKAMFGKTTLAERPDVAEREAANIRAKDTKQAYHAIHAVIDRGSITAKLGLIQTPTLVMVGDQDAATPPHYARRIAAQIAGARLEVLPQAGHLSTLEVPAMVSTLITDFLAAHSWA
jgi:pimeloyl-ACP methyl ester carboxylesterase